MNDSNNSKTFKSRGGRGGRSNNGSRGRGRGSSGGGRSGRHNSGGGRGRGGGSGDGCGCGSGGGRGRGLSHGGGGTRSAPTTPMKQRPNSSSAGGGNQSNLRSHSNIRSATPQHQKSGHGPKSSTRNIATQPLKKDGEKGASAHTVSEQYRIQLTQLLMNLRETHDDENGANDSITLPADLTNTQRKFVHELSKKLGLKSKSYGKGQDRKVVVTKVSSKSSTLRGSTDCDGGVMTEEQMNSIPKVILGTKGEEALRNHLEKFPPSKREDAEGRETGSGLLLGEDGNEDSIDEENYDEEVIEGSALEANDDGDDLVNETMKTLVPLNDVLKPSSTPDTNENEQTQIQLSNKMEKLIQSRKRYHEQARQQMKSHPQYKIMMQQRTNLPAFGYAEDICKVLRDTKNQVVILTGDTGCGKSTQVPQFILDDPALGPTCNILITQPRRISAISVAERVASERCQPVGQSIGYSVRLESCLSKKTQLMFVTPGVLMKRMNPTDSNPFDNEEYDDFCEAHESGGNKRNSPLAEFTIIIMDEIHERDKNTEFLMIALQDLLEEREELQLILMSATMPTRDLAEYWCQVGRRRQQRKRELKEIRDGAPRDEIDLDEGEDCVMPVEINIPGRTFPVQEFFLEDILAMTGYVDEVHGDAPDFEQIESDLMTLLSGSKYPTSKSAGSRKSKENTSSLLRLDNTLTCVMCNKSGFRSPEEFGTHVAFCDGGGNTSMLELENRVKSINVSSVMGYDDSAPNNSGIIGTEGVAEDDDDDLAAILEEEMEDYEDDDEPGLVGGKWDGESPFVIDSAGPSTKPTLTEEEMLSRYQTTYDDEEINYDLALDLIRYVVKSSYGDGAILVFLPGWAEISEFSLTLESTEPFNDKSQFVVYPLHSGIPSKDQRQVFLRPPNEVRKIILSTNIAETSLTIEDVAFVIDTGRAKEKSYDPHLKTSTLKEEWISQASAKQRTGRAGRCKAGVCFHLFSKRRHACMRPFVESELIRTPLEEICLQCKRLQLTPGGLNDPDGIPAFLSKAMTPPHPKSVINALDLLVELGAMDEYSNDLTDLGICLSNMSLEPRVGKMVVMSFLIGCSKAASWMAVGMSYKSPFALPPPSLRKAADSAKVNLSEGSESDQITTLNVLRTRDTISKRGMGSLAGWCRSTYLNFSSLNMISDLRRNVSRELESLGFPPVAENGYHNRNGDFNPAFLQAAICAGLYPNVAFRREGDVNFSTMSNKKARIHLSSVNAVKSQPLSKKCQVSSHEVEFVIFGELVKGKIMFTMENTTHLVSPLPLLLLCGQLRVRPIYFVSPQCDEHETVSIDRAVLTVDDWLTFLAESEIARGLIILRKRLDSAFSAMTSDPTSFADLSPVEKDAVNTLSVVLNSAYKAAPKR